jgi:hypothetical protein
LLELASQASLRDITPLVKRLQGLKCGSTAPNHVLREDRLDIVGSHRRDP